MGRTGQTLRRKTAQTIGQRSSGTGQAHGSGTGWGARLRYGFDNTMSRGTPALVGWLFVVTIALVLFFAVVDVVFRLREGGIGFADASFQALMHALDPGTVAGDTGSWRFKITMLVLTIAGLFIVSALIGVIAAGIDARIADLRRGRSVVLEKEHTVILGWSDSVFTVISELTIANESRRKPVIAVLAPLDKVDMEDEIRAKVPDLKGTRVVVRSGSPTDIDDLALVSPSTARSVVVLSPAGVTSEETFEPDREVIKTLLALRSSDGDGEGPRVVAQLRDPANLEVARLIGRDRPGRTALLDIRETVAKLVVQTSRQSGAAAVYRELFDYDGDEIYFLAEHGLAASTYADALLHYEDVSVIGLAEGTGALLNPPADTVIGDRALIVVAEDDSVLATAPRSTTPVDTGAFADAHVEEPRPSHAVLIGWNERAAVVVSELDRYAAPGSTLTVLSSYGEPEAPPVTNLSVTVVAASTTQRSVLDEHVPADADQVLVLCYSDHLDAEAADATTLITLLHVRDILARSDSSTPVVSEMIDDRNRALAQVADIDDVVVSGEIVSLIVAQLSEDARIEPVLADLLDSDGSEIYLRPAEWYVAPGRETTWATVVASAARRGETAIGFSSPGLAEPGSRVGVVVNPAKSEPLNVEAGDRVVVLAEL
ncbi:CASTOR/POLLUX-related putative ion channel [Nocardioides sp. LML1-1-1.1]|uniref:CASTOR/POLLUX-related putative ion channel n=1 Tax=Nocardioides sp. LML1-1-1.1 TaxID=3135248 RepID=UPI003430DA18